MPEKPDFQEFEAKTSIQPTNSQHKTVKFDMEGVGRPAKSGANWIVSAWEIFMKSPLMWIGFSLICLFVQGFVQYLDYLEYFDTFVWFLLVGSMVYCAYRLDQGSEMDIVNLFYAFKIKYIIAIFLLLVPEILFSIYRQDLLIEFSNVLNQMASSSENNYQPLIDLIKTNDFSVFVVLLILIYFIYLIPVTIALPLILLHNFTPLWAMRSAVLGILKNIIPFLINTFLMFLLLILSILTLLLGFLVFTPLSMIIIYTIYKDIFFRLE